MNFIQFLIAFAGLVVGVSTVAMLFWYFSKALKKNVIVRNSNCLLYTSDAADD